MEKDKKMTIKYKESKKNKTLDTYGFKSDTLSERQKKSIYSSFGRYLCPNCDSMRTEKIYGEDKKRAKYICHICGKKFFIINGKMELKDLR